MKPSSWLACLLPLFGLVPAHAQIYSVTDLGTLGGTYSVASGINSSGTIVGDSLTSGGQDHAFSYSGGVMTDLATMGETNSHAIAMNDDGIIVGQGETGAP